jgi:hypothetical protein
VDWWQIVLILLVAVVAGVLAGGLVSYLVRRFLRKPFIEKSEVTTVVEEQPKFTKPALPAEDEKTPSIERIASLLKRPFVQKRESTVVVEEQQALTAPDLLAEVENNHRIATEPWAGKLLQFQTEVWDASQDGVANLPTNLREDLTQAYVDMRLANSIVWLSTELGRRSNNLDKSYLKLCTNIATRFDKIMPLLKRSGN